MTKESLAIIDADMESLGLNYAFQRWTDDDVDTYFVGEFAGVPSDSLEAETSFILTGFTRGAFIELMDAQEKIEKLYRNGKTAILDSGTGVAVLFENTLGNLPTGVAEVQKIQINLTIKEWKVN